MIDKNYLALLGFDKLLASLRGTSVLQRSLDRLLECDAIHSIVIVCPEDRWSTLRIPSSEKVVTRADGGQLRQDSVRAGIRATPSHATHIAIHDAARPLVSHEDLARVIHTAQDSGAATLAHRIVDTLKRSDESNHIRESVSRDQLWGMETPQVFAIGLLRQALARECSDHPEFTDEASLLQSAGQAVLLVESLHPNPKITTPADLTLAAAILSLSESVKS